MNRGTRRLWLRIGLALTVAAGGVVALQVLVKAEDRRARAAEPPPPLEVAPSPLLALGIRLQPVATEVLVASRLDALAVDVAPVVQVMRDGSLALRRGAPTATGPTAAAIGGSGHVGIVLPARDLAELGPAARGALLELLAAWIGDRPVGRSRLRFVDVTAAAAATERLLTWVP